MTGVHVHLAAYLYDDIEFNRIASIYIASILHAILKVNYV